MFLYQDILRCVEKKIVISEYKNFKIKKINLALANYIRGVISSIMGEWYVNSVDNKKISCIAINNLYSYAMTENLSYDEIKMDKNVKLGVILITPDDSYTIYFVEND